jgi:hypothetical protein
MLLTVVVKCRRLDLESLSTGLRPDLGASLLIA